VDSPQKVVGFYIPSHRTPFRYQQVGSISVLTRPWTHDGFESVQNAVRSNAQGGGGNPSNFYMKEIIVGLAIFGHGNAIVQPDLEAMRLFRALEDTFRRVLPASIGFKSLAVRDRSEIVLETDSGDFLLDASSGGMAALIELTWQIFMFQETNPGPFTVVIDEP